MLSMKLAASALAVALAVAVAGAPPAPAVAAQIQPGQVLPRTKSYQLAACPQPSLARCIHVCETKYNGTRCEGWCRERACT